MPSYALHHLYCHVIFALQIDENGDEYVSEKEVTRALQLANLKLPSYQIRDLLNNLKTEGKLQNDGKIPKGVFKEVHR